MKRLVQTVVPVLALAATVTVLACAQSSQAAPMGMKMAAPITVKGTLVDTKCYSMNSMNVGNDHMTPKGKMPSCATACASMGIPAGVVDASGKLYVIVAPANIFAKHMAKTARITGPPAIDGHGIIAKKVQVKEGGQWVDVQVATMM